MARQYLAEGLKGAFPFIADAKNIVVESLPNGKTRTRIPGRFSVCDCVNGNGRRYGRRVWEKNLDTGSNLMESIRRNAAFGLLEHPKDGQVTLLSPISHLVTDAKLQKGQDTAGKEIWEVIGEIQVLGTEEGKKLTALIEAGYNPLVSSRGFGSLVRATDGVDDVQDDYVCEGWDVVIKPSFETAELNPPRETTLTTTEAASPKAASSSSAATITENSPPAAPPAAPPAPPAAAKPNLEPAACAQVPAPGSTPVKTTNESSQDTTMNLNEIKQAIASFRSTEARKLQPKQFAEGMAQLGALHQEVANYLAEDTKRSWQATQLQNEITAIETAWNETQLAPVKTAAKLNENNTKLMQVIKAVAKTGLVYKNQLGESVKQATRQSALLNEVVERGRAWRQVAKANESAAAKYKRRFMMASETLTQLADKYKSDVVELGRRVITLEFGDKAQTPEIQKMLKEATKPKQIVEIRNILEGKTPPAAPVAEGATAASPKAKQPKAAPPVAEGNKPAVPPAGKPQAPVSEGVTILSQTPKDPRDLNEAVGMVNRLSKAMVQG